MKKGMFIMAMSLLVIGGAAFYAGAAGKGLAHADKKFMKAAASGGMMEVEAGRMAQQQGQSAEVKKFGELMATDHGKANQELQQLAQQKDMKLPKKPERKDMSEMKKMQKMTGAEFDKAYMRAMVKDHVKDVNDFRTATQEVKDPDLKAWATKTLPVLEDHLRQAKDVAGKVGVDVQAAEQEGMRAAK